MEIIVPGDKQQVELALEYAVCRKNPVYIRLSRNEVPELPKADGFAAKTPLLLKEGTEVTIAATGLAAQWALDAADLLERDGIKADVFSAPFVKPLETESLESSLKKTRKLVTVEEHSVIGGFGSACLEKLARKDIHFSYLPIGIQDTFGDTGSYQDLLAAYGLSADAIADAVKAFL
jgi:transketolase